MKQTYVPIFTGIHNQKLHSDCFIMSIWFHSVHMAKVGLSWVENNSSHLLMVLHTWSLVGALAKDAAVELEHIDETVIVIVAEKKHQQ